MIEIIDGKKYEIEIEFSSSNVSLFDLILCEIEKNENAKEINFNE